MRTRSGRCTTLRGRRRARASRRICNSECRSTAAARVYYETPHRTRCLSEHRSQCVIGLNRVWRNVALRHRRDCPTAATHARATQGLQRHSGAVHTHASGRWRRRQPAAQRSAPRCNRMHRDATVPLVRRVPLALSAICGAPTDRAQAATVGPRCTVIGPAAHTALRSARSMSCTNKHTRLAIRCCQALWKAATLERCTLWATAEPMRSSAVLRAL